MTHISLLNFRGAQQFFCQAITGNSYTESRSCQCHLQPLALGGVKMLTSPKAGNEQTNRIWHTKFERAYVPSTLIMRQTKSNLLHSKRNVVFLNLFKICFLLIILLMVQKSQGQPPGTYQKRCKWWDVHYQPQLVTEAITVYREVVPRPLPRPVVLRQSLLRMSLVFDKGGWNPEITAETSWNGSKIKLKTLLTHIMRH